MCLLRSAVLACVTGPILILAATPLRAQQAPKFKEEVSIVRLDVTAVGNDGYPVSDLTSDDFQVAINGKREPVLSVQYVAYSQGQDAPPQSARGYSTNTSSIGRLTVVLVDEAHLVPGQERNLLTGLQQFLGQTRREDRTALISVPGASARVDFTNDVSLLQKAVTHLRAWPASAPDLKKLSLDKGEPPAPMFAAEKDGKLTADDINPVVDTMSAIADSLKGVEGPKSLVLVTAKLPGLITQLPAFQEFAKHAAAARLKVYGIRQQAVPSDVVSTSTNTGRIQDVFLDGLDILAGATGGTTIDGIARATGAFDRIDRETRGAYVIAVQLPAGTNPNKSIEATIHVQRPGVTVRGPKQLVPALQSGTKGSARDHLHALLSQPRAATEIPLYVTSYSARGPNKPKAIILAEIREGTFSRPLEWGYEVRSGNKVLFGQTERVEGQAASRSLAITSAPDLAAGDYVLRFGVVDADGRRGSIERALHVMLVDGGDYELSDVFVGTASDGHFHPHVEIDPRMGHVTASLDIYPKHSLAQLENTRVEMTLRGDDGQRRDGISLTPLQVGGKGIVEVVFPLRDLTEGGYQICGRLFTRDQAVGEAVCQSFLLRAGQ